MSQKALDITIVGGGMITHDQILPSIYELQRRGDVGAIKICALNSAPLRALAEAPTLAEAFPGQSFEPFPALDTPDDEMHPELFRNVVAAMPPGNMVIVAVPDHLHTPVIRFALEHGQHVMTVKPLVLKYTEAVEIERMAHEQGLFVGVEYHKRFDRRSLEARLQYRAGRLGEFRCGEAKMIEPYYYRHSNFQNWFTKENTDPFTYVGCHYVDLVYFITGLKPVEVTVRGVEGTFPNGKVGYLWSAGQVVWENGAVLSVINGLGYPDEAPGTNDQALCLYGEGPDGGTILQHNDQFRGCGYGYTDKAAGAAFRHINPDYFRLVPWQGDGLKPVGYGFDSVEASVLSARDVNAAGKDLPHRC
ncbi:MAG: Gfo/Idh/MocA family oxidoreductase, partial [Pirellulales bacterium]|nr:Gfo/Idh/MocA family oxidoreductase [Pirellulales bacterium]